MLNHHVKRKMITLPFQYFHVNTSFKLIEIDLDPVELKAVFLELCAF